MVKKYRTNGYEILSVEIERETENSVWISGRRHSKMSDYHCYFETWDDAHAHLRQTREQRVLNARRQLDHCMGDLEKIIAMRKPEDAA
jgi:hypothetical protein